MSTDLTKHLGNKKRSVSDLIHFVKTRTDGVSNYTLLIGAGASYTSGIRTGANLVEQWRKEFYQKYCEAPDNPYSAESAKMYLAREHSQWYSPQREYSSLFERKFDLPRQRRMFVENEVAGKFPSLGYAYLIRLIEKNYFNAIFTTNFDDLLNEAFHQFSDLRPIVCAHDSSISSITVTSKRPKIIKLHGDYLFDDIKSTVRETESLEENTKKKLIEFSKDHGLIVIGYGGHDRSVMDVIQYLLKQDDYLKHGVYWCLRPEETPCEELVKLLWRERAYWVPVDGFDELAAELHKECLSDALPITTALVSEKPREVIRRFCADSYLQKSPSAILQKDLARLKQESGREALFDAMRPLTDVDDEDRLVPGRMKDADLIVSMEVSKLVRDRDLAGAQARIDKELLKNPSDELKLSLLKQRLEAEQLCGNNVAALQTLEGLLAEDPHNVQIMMRRAKVEKSYDERLSSLNRAVEMDPYHPGAYRQRAELKRERLFSEPSKEDRQLCSEIVSDFESSLRVSPSIQNPSWSAYFDFISDELLDASDSDRISKEILRRVGEMDALSDSYLSLRVRDVVRRDADDSEKDELLAEILRAIEVHAKRDRDDLELVYLDALKNFGKAKDLARELSKRDTDPKWLKNSDYVYFRATEMAETEGKIREAIRWIDSSEKLKKEVRLLTLFVRLCCLVGQASEANAALSSHKYVTPAESRRLQYEVLAAEGNHDQAAALASEMKDSESRMVVIYRTHALLKAGRHHEAEQIARTFLEKSNFSAFFGTVILNMELAIQRRGGKVDKPRLQRVLDRRKVDKAVKACVYLLMDDKVHAAQCACAAAREDKTFPYEAAHWALYDNPQNRAWLRQTLKAEGLDGGAEFLDRKTAQG